MLKRALGGKLSLFFRGSLFPKKERSLSFKSSSGSFPPSDGVFHILVLNEPGDLRIKAAGFFVIPLSFP
jgi:hypothetical protein